MNYGSWAGGENQAGEHQHVKCNGGVFRTEEDQLFYRKCGVSAECREYTENHRPYYDRRHLPVLSEERRARVIATTQNSPYNITGRQMTPDDLPTSLRQLTEATAVAAATGGTQGTRAAIYNAGGAPMGVSPTFLPGAGQNVFTRLFHNVLNGVVGSLGWHLFSYAQAVDIFGRR